jgi:hypothetical protein
MSLFNKKFQTQPPTDFDQESESKSSGSHQIQRPVSEYDAITIDGIPYTKPKKWQFWKKDMAIEETKEYLYFYNQKKSYC